MWMDRLIFTLVRQLLQIRNPIGSQQKQAADLNLFSDSMVPRNLFFDKATGVLPDLPVAYWLMKEWLNDFAYGTEFDSAVFLMVIAVSFLLVIIFRRLLRCGSRQNEPGRCYKKLTVIFCMEAYKQISILFHGLFLVVKFCEF